jgi:hypothetical protein
MNEPLTGRSVVRPTTVEPPGISAVWVIQLPPVCGGKACVDRALLTPATLIVLTLAPGAAKAKPNCWGAFEGIAMLSV